MSSLRYRALLCSSAFAIAFAAGAAVSVPDTAHAQTKIYGAGGIGATRMFRRVFNCYSGTATTRSVDVNDPVLGANQFDAPQCTATANASVRIGLAPTTDSNSLRAFTLRTPSLVGDPNSFDQSVPYSSSIDTVPLPNSPVLGAALLSFSRVTSPRGYWQHHFSVSEAVIPQTSLSAPTISYDCFSGNPLADPSCTVDQRTVAGQAVLVPTMVSTVNLPFRIPGRTSLRLSARSYCGIFTGNITDWNHPHITAVNGGSVTGGASQRIRVVYPRLSSGTTFLLTKHLEAVCTTSRTGFDWVGGVGLTATWSRPFFYGARHVEEVAGTVAGTTWSIGYVPPDLTLPAISTLRQPVTVTLLDGNGFNPITIAAGTYSARPRAALQNQSGAWVLPTPASGVSAMASVVPPAGAAATNPANWGLAGSISDPIPAAAYPISGFVWMNAYSCYSSTDVGQGLRGFFSWHTNAVNTQITTILNARQFGRLPGNWQTAVRNLVVNAPLTRIAGVREVLNPNCTGRPGA